MRFGPAKVRTFDLLCHKSALKCPMERIMKLHYNSAKGSNLSIENYVVFRYQIYVCAQLLMGTGTLIQKPLYKPMHQQGNGGLLEI